MSKCETCGGLDPNCADPKYTMDQALDEIIKWMMPGDMVGPFIRVRATLEAVRSELDRRQEKIKELEQQVEWYKKPKELRDQILGQRGGA